MNAQMAGSVKRKKNFKYGELCNVYAKEYIKDSQPSSISLPANLRFLEFMGWSRHTAQHEKFSQSAIMMYIYRYDPMSICNLKVDSVI